MPADGFIPAEPLRRYAIFAVFADAAAACHFALLIIDYFSHTPLLAFRHFD